MDKQAKNTICLWYDGDAEDAARFYAETFPDSSVGAVHVAPGDFPGGKKGDVLTVEFTVMGIPCLGLNGGSAFKHNEAFSFQLQPLTRLKPIVTGTQSSGTAAKRVHVGGARTNGACPVRLRRSL
jgi:predicted 3-demethylubiquinone-9 3-methyltransferase (glyoxalase superfamily)